MIVLIIGSLCCGTAFGAFPWKAPYVLCGGQLPPEHYYSRNISHSHKNWEFERDSEMLGKLGTLFSSITASSGGSKDFPYTSTPSTELTSLWSYCKASKKVGNVVDSHISACFIVIQGNFIRRLMVHWLLSYHVSLQIDQRTR